jgi:hypothetical protein
MMPAPNKIRTTLTKNPPQLKDTTTRPLKMHSRDSQIFDWIQTNPTPRRHLFHPRPDSQTGPDTATHHIDTKPSMKREAARQRYSTDTNKAVNGDDDDDDKRSDRSSSSVLESVDCWNRLSTKGEETHHEAVFQSANEPTFSRLSALEDTLVLILCVLHWLTITTIVCALSGLVIVAKTGYRLGLRANHI